MPKWPHTKEQLLNRLTGYEVKFFSDYHWRVDGIDFWPSRQKWRNIKTKESSQGVDSLLKQLKGKE